MNGTKYYVKGTVRGTRSYDDYTEDIDSVELLGYMDEISAMFTKDPDDELAQYIDEDEEIYGVVTEIWAGVKNIGGKMYSFTEVTATRELTDDEKKNLLDYLTGQFSDGYGEGLEQHAFLSYEETETCEEWDEEEQECYMEEYEVTVYCYLHLWQRKDFKLEFCSSCDHTYAVHEEASNACGGTMYQCTKCGKFVTELPKPVKPIAKLIGADGNIFNLLGIAQKALRKAGMSEQAKEMTHKVTESNSYSAALAIISEYVEVM